jgi:hypothetical protein
MIKIINGLITIQSTWTSLKDTVSNKNLSIHYDEDSEKYNIFTTEGVIAYNTIIYKGAIPALWNVDQATNDASKTDFETNYKYAVSLRAVSNITGTVNCTRGNDATTPVFITGSINVAPTSLQIITGSVSVNNLINSNITGTINLDRGNNASTPLYITGSINVSPPAVQNISATGSLSVIIQNQPLNITGSVGITNPVVITSTGSLPVSFSGVQNITGTIGVVNQVNITSTGSLLITGTVGISNPVNIANQITITTTGSIPVIFGGIQTITGTVGISGPINSQLSGSVNLARGNDASTPLFITGSINVSAPAVQIITSTGSLPVVIQNQPNITGSVGITNQVIITSTGSLPITGNVGISTPVNIANQISITTTGSLPVSFNGIQNITGSVVVSNLINSNITGTVNLDRGNTSLSPLFITGTVGISAPINIGNQIAITTTGSLPVIIQGNITGSVGITNPVVISNQIAITSTGSIPVSFSGVQNITGSVGIAGITTSQITGTINLDRGNVSSIPLFVSGSVGITNPIAVSNQIAITTTGSIPVNIQNQSITITGSVGIANQISITSTGSLPITGTVSLNSPVSISNQIAITTTGSIPVSLSGVQSITGTVGISGLINSQITGTVNLDRGNTFNSPLFTTGSVGITNPVVVSNQIVITSTGSLPVIIQGQPLSITGSVGITNPIAISNQITITTTGSLPVSLSGVQTITGSVGINNTINSQITGTVNLDRGNTLSSPLFVSGTITTIFPIVQTITTTGSLPITGSVSISTPINIANQIAITTTGSIPVIFSGNQNITGTVNLDRGNTSNSPLFVSGSVTISSAGVQVITSTGSLPITGTVSLNSPVVVSNQITITTTGSIPVSFAGVQTITGSVGISGLFNSQITGTINLDRGNTSLVPLFITGSVGISAPINVGNQIAITTTGSLPVIFAGTQTITGTVGISGIINSQITGTVNLDRGNNFNVPLFTTGSVGITNPIVVSNQIAITTTGSIPVSFGGIQTITGTVGISGLINSNITGTVNLDRGNSSISPLFITGSINVSPPAVQNISATGSLLITGSVGITNPIVVSNQIAITSTGSLLITGTVGITNPVNIANQISITTTGSLPITGTVVVSGYTTVVGPALSSSAMLGNPVVCAFIDASSSVRIPLSDFDGTIFVQDRNEPTFIAWVTGSAVGSNKSMMSIYNATGSIKIIKIREVWLTNVQTGSIVGSPDVFEFRRITGHSTGTQIVLDIETMDTADTLSPFVSIRTGATVASESPNLLWKSVWSTDEWLANTADVETEDHSFQQMFPLYQRRDVNEKPITLRAGNGLTIKHATTATLGTFTVGMVFTQIDTR